MISPVNASNNSEGPVLLTVLTSAHEGEQAGAVAKMPNMHNNRIRNIKLKPLLLQVRQSQIGLIQTTSAINSEYDALKVIKFNLCSDDGALGGT